MKQSFLVGRVETSTWHRIKKETLSLALFGVFLFSLIVVANAAPSDKGPLIVPVLQLLLLDSDADFPDRDGDGVPDIRDDFPDDPSEDKDTDGDGIGDNADPNPNSPDSLVITSAIAVNGEARISWVSYQPDDYCRVLYGPRGARPTEDFSDTSEVVITGLTQPGTYDVLLECYFYDGSSEFSSPVSMEVL